MRDGERAAGSADVAAGRVGLGAQRTIDRELDDALYYLRHDCVPCADRHFDLARRRGATEEMITQVRDQARPASPK
jgi:Carboxymuconolactone decarboxylase family